MNIAIFGGSFDPVTSAHVEICERLLEDFTEVWVIPTHNSPFKKTKTSLVDRLKMLQIAFSKYENIYVKDLEKQVGSNYSIDLVKFLNRNFADKFTLVIGSDHVYDLEKWKSYHELKDLIDFYIVKRNNDLIQANLVYKNRISSTIARYTKDSEIAEVNNFIREKNLYSNDYDDVICKLKNTMNKKRFYHSINVMHTAFLISENLPLKKEDVFLATIYHDYAKATMNRKEEQLYMKRFCSNLSLINSSLYHGVIAYHMFEKELSFEVREAILCHSTSCESPSLLAKVLFIADFIEPLKGYDKYHEFLKKAIKDVEQAYLAVFAKKKAYLVNEGCYDERAYLLISKEVENERIKNSCANN